MNTFSFCVDEHKQKSAPVTTPTRYHRSLFPRESERLDPILEKRLEILFLSNTGNISPASCSLKNLQDYLLQKKSILSSEAEIFLVGSVASSVLDKAQGSKDIDLRVMLPQTIVDTSRSDLLITCFLQQYAPKTKTQSWRPIFQTHTAPDRTSCTYQIGCVDLNFRAKAPAYLSVNKSDGFAIRLSDRQIFCIDQQTYCSSKTSFEDGYRQLIEKIYTVSHFQYLRGIELRVLKKATLGHYIQEAGYFKAFPTRIRTEYYLNDALGGMCEGWVGKKEWWAAYKKHLQIDYPSCLQGNERVRVYALDILNLLICMDSMPRIFAEKLASVWGSCLPSARGSLINPLYFLELYPEKVASFLQLVQALVCCHHLYRAQEGRALLSGYTHSYALLLRRGDTVATIQDLKEGFSSAFDQIASFVQQSPPLLASLQSLFDTLGLPDIPWTDPSKIRYVFLLSWQADPSIQKLSPLGLSLLKDAFFSPKNIAHWSHEQHRAFLDLFHLPWMKLFLPTVVAQPEIAKALEEALSAHKQICTSYHQLIRTIGIFLKYSTIPTLPTLQLMREILADTLLEEAQQVQAAICEMTKTLNIPFLRQLQPTILQRIRKKSSLPVAPKKWRIALRRIQSLFTSLQNVQTPLHTVSEEIQQITNKAQKSRWIYQKEQNVILQKLVPFHLQTRQHEELASFQVFTHLLHNRIQVYAQRTQQKEYCYWFSLYTAVASQCVKGQIASLPFLKAPPNRLFYILHTPMSLQRTLSIALQTSSPYSMEESQALLQVCMKAPCAFMSLKTQEDLLDFGDFLVEKYPLTPSHEELYKTFSQLISLLFGQSHPSLQDLGYRLFCSLPAIPRLSTQPLRKAWTQMAKTAFSFLVRLEDYDKLSAIITPIYQQLDYNHCFALTLHIQSLAVSFHLKQFSQLAEIPLLEESFPNGIIPFPKTASWSPTSLQLHRLIQSLHDGIILYEMYPALFRNAIDLIAGLMIRTPNHSFDLLHDAYAMLDKFYQILKDHHRPPGEMTWYAKYIFSFAIHTHALAAISRDLSYLEGLIPRLTGVVSSFVEEMQGEDIVSLVHSCLLFTRDFVLLSLLKNDPNIFMSFLDRVIQPLLEKLRTSQHSPIFFLNMSKALGEMCIDLFFLDSTINGIPQIFFPSTRPISAVLDTAQKPKLTALKKKLESKLAFSTIKATICATKIKDKDLGFICDAIRFYAYSKRYMDTSVTNMKILAYLHKTIFVFCNRVAQKEHQLFFRQLWDDVYHNLHTNAIKTGNIAMAKELQQTASQCPLLTVPPVGNVTDSIRAAIAKSPKVKRPTL